MSFYPYYVDFFLVREYVKRYHWFDAKKGNKIFVVSLFAFATRLSQSQERHKRVEARVSPLKRRKTLTQFFSSNS